MPVYLIVGPAVAVIGIVAVFFVMRHKSVQTRSMYSSRRSQFERKVRAARQRTLAPSGRGGHAPTSVEIAATAVEAPPQPMYQAPAPLPKQAWDSGPTSAPAYTPEPAPPSAPAEPFSTAPAEPAWTPGPVEPPSWTPTPAPAIDYTPPAPAPAPPRPAPAPAMEEPLTPAGGGAAWSIVGDSKSATERAPAKEKGKDKKKAKEAEATGGAWELASGVAPTDEDAEDAKASSPAMAVVQYAVLVVGLVMVLIGVLVMVANSRVT
jgi:uncharacterized integral membrane protein